MIPTIKLWDVIALIHALNSLAPTDNKGLIYRQRISKILAWICNRTHCFCRRNYFSKPLRRLQLLEYG